MIFSFGDLNIDLLWNFPVDYEFTKLPDRGKFTCQMGGVAFNFAKIANQFGEDCCVIGKVGGDLFGEYILNEVKASKIKNLIVRDEDRQSGVISHFTFKKSKSNDHRFMTHNVSNANRNISIQELKAFNIDFGPKDILFLTGYSLFDRPVDEAADYIIKEAQNKSCKIIFDLLPHNLQEAGESTDLFKKLTETLKKPADLIIGEYKTWNYLLFNNSRVSENPGIHDLEEIAQQTASIAKFISIRYGYQNCGKEALFYNGKLLYIKDTGYKDLNEEERLGYGEKLTISILQQFFSGIHTWIYNESTRFTTPLSVLDMLPGDLSHESRILDIGCGYGRAFEALRQKGFKKISGSDISISMVHKAKELYPDIQVYHASVNDLKEKGLKYDVCLLLGVLTTIQNDRDIIKLLEDISYMLDKNGLLLIADFCINDDERHQERYEKYKSLFPGSDYGLFISENGAINRHFNENFIYSVLKKNYLITSHTMEDFITVNNNLSKGFMILCQKP